MVLQEECGHCCDILVLEEAGALCIYAGQQRVWEYPPGLMEERIKAFLPTVCASHNQADYNMHWCRVIVQAQRFVGFHILSTIV